MVTLTSFPLLRGYVAFFLFVIIGAKGTTAVPCPTKAIVDLTGTKPYSSGYAKKDGDIYPPNSTWSQGDKKFGCLCTFKTCISLCCDLNEARQDGRCVKDLSVLPRSITFIHDDYNEREDIPEQNYHLFKNDPCDTGWMRSSFIKNVSVFKNGSIYAPEFKRGTISDLDQYCLMREPNSTKYVAKVCRPWVRKGGYEIFCVIVAILIMLAIFVTYTKEHRLKNLHGLIFRSYVATYVMIYVSALGVMFTTELRINPFWFRLIELIVRYFCSSCAFWLTVMSFNMWRSFRDLRPRFPEFEAEEKKKFIWYAMYAWITPFLALTIDTVVKTYVPYFGNEIIAAASKRWGGVVIITLALICNIFLHTSTALRIRQQKKDLAGILNGMNRHYEMNKQWFNLYSKLFVMMGVHLVVWPIFLLLPTSAVQHILATMEVLQSILIFVFFIWNDNVKLLLRQQCGVSWIIRNIRKISIRRLTTQTETRKQSGLSRRCEVELKDCKEQGDTGSA